MARGNLVPGLVLALLAGGCSSDEPARGGAAGSSSLSGEVSCSDDPRVDPFSAGMAKDGARGALTFELLTSDPAPPAKGDNAWTLRIVDAADEPADVSLEVQLSMPDHGHGSPVVPKISRDAGHFSVAPLNLFMAGVWQIDFHAKDSERDDETPLDDVSFFFCIEG
jgi:hypothetical protein